MRSLVTRELEMGCETGMSLRCGEPCSNICCITTKTGRTSGLGRELRTTDLVRRLRVPSLLLNDSPGCTIVTIGPLENQDARYEPHSHPIYIGRVKAVGCTRRRFKH